MKLIFQKFQSFATIGSVYFFNCQFNFVICPPPPAPTPPARARETPSTTPPPRASPSPQGDHKILMIKGKRGRDLWESSITLATQLNEK